MQAANAIPKDVSGGPGRWRGVAGSRRAALRAGALPLSGNPPDIWPMNCAGEHASNAGLSLIARAAAAVQ